MAVESAKGDVPEHHRKRLLKAKKRIGKREEFWDSRESKKRKELHSLLPSLKYFRNDNPHYLLQFWL